MDITKEHPHFIAARPLLTKYSDLYIGGDQLKSRADWYLERRQKEPLDIYSERLSRLFYENYIGSIIDWFGATLFQREPRISFVAPATTDTEFYCTFLDDSDRRGTRFSSLLRKMFLRSMIYGRTFALIDLPRVENPPHNRRQEHDSCLSRAYALEFTPDQLINWSHQSDGSFDWVVFRNALPDSAAQPGDQPYDVTEWLYFDREHYQIYRQSRPDKPPTLTAEGRHSLAHERKVPIVELSLPDGLWLMNKAGLLQLEYLNKSNALSWALSLGLFAMPVIYSEREWKQIIGESYYIQLGPTDKFGWTEPEGHVYQIASDNLRHLKEELYRVCYLPHHGRPLNIGDSGQSGVSRQREFLVTQSILRAYGDVIKDFARNLMRNVSSARHDGATLTIEGLDDFDIGNLTEEIDHAERLLKLGVPSKLFIAQLYKRLASQYLSDLSQDVKTCINGEIDAGILDQKGVGNRND